jgi:3-oxoadipate CoA-transferase beta subunit
MAESAKPRSRTEMAARVAADLKEGWCVNLGIGMPTLVADAVPAGCEIIFQSENGLLGMGPAPDEAARDRWLINAGKQHVTIVPGGSFFHHADSFALIRGGHINLCILGAYEVADNGDFANWAISESDAAPAVGGAMDLAVGAARIWVMMEHTTREGRPRLVRTCSYPLTAPGVVTRIYTNLAVLDVEPRGLRIIEMAEGVSRAELAAKTDARLL